MTLGPQRRNTMIIKNSKTYWILSLTWGIIMTMVGLIAAAGFMLFGARPHPLGHGLVFYIGKGWGGITLGPVSFCSKTAPITTVYHEYGHSIQNCVFGPGMVFIGLASLARATWRTFTKPKTDYDSVWFEAQASAWGNKNLQGR